MESTLIDWLGLLVRWAHVMLGVLWIGASFFFIFLDASLRKPDKMPDTMGGESWLVHGGGFYLVQKFKVAPEKLPKELHWFQYEAYFTWVTGMLLLAIVYYLQAEAFMIDKELLALDSWEAIAISLASLTAGWVVYDLLCRSPIRDKTALLATSVFVLIAIASYFFTHVFSGRAAFVHIGAFIGTIMAFNVFMIIIPNQRIVVADLVAGRVPDGNYGKIAKQRSLHNNFLTLPVIFMMISNHYPITFGHEQAWLVALGIVIIGGLIRHFYNSLDEGKLDWSGKAALPAGVVVLLGVIAITLNTPGSDKDAAEVKFPQIYEMVQKHCATCHAVKPTNELVTKPPAGLLLERPEQIKAASAKIRLQAVFSKTMPLGNQTGMTVEERKLLGDWIAQGSNIE